MGLGAVDRLIIFDQQCNNDLTLLTSVTGRKRRKEGTSVQDPSDWRARHGKNVHHQTLRAPVLLTTLQSHHRGGLCSQSTQLGR